MTFRKLKKILNEAAFNPQKPTGILKIILESGNQEYFLQRAKELLHEASNLILESDLSRSIYYEKIKNAISLLALTSLIQQEKTISKDK